MKRIAAIILSAALMISDIPQTQLTVSAASEQEQTQTAETMAETESSETERSQVQESEAETAQTDASETQSEEAESSETQPEETEIEVETETEETDASETQSEEAESSETQPEETEIETEIETETEETEIPETETLEMETETEVLETETEEAETQTSVPVPVVDSDVSVYEESKETSLSTQNISAFSYTAVEALTEVAAGVYNIENKDQFLTFLATESDYAGSTVNLVCDIDMKSEIARFDRSFNGVFNGNGHSIYNVTIEQGLFRSIGNEGEVKTLHISDAVFAGTAASGVVTAINYGKITNCVVTGNLQATEDMSYTGGIAGTNEDIGTITGCVFSGNITATSGTADTGKNIGGIAGNNKGTINSCYALGTISTKAAKIAGIAGENSGTILDCSNYMSIEGTFTIAGIAAYNSGEITDCANYGTVQQRSYDQAIGEAGGIAAQNTRSGVISKSYNYAAITGGSKNIAGISGTNAGELSECGNYGTITGFANCGGIAGLYNGVKQFSISKCFNYGTIVGNGSNDTAIGIGGILGSSDSGYTAPIESSYNVGNIRVSESTRYIGGIAGIIKEGSIKNSYSAGTISGAGKDAYAAMLAGFLGAEAVADYADCLFIDGNIAYACYRETGAVADDAAKKTADELKSEEALRILGAAFAADNSNINNGYPVINTQAAAKYVYPVIYELEGGCADYYYHLVENGATVSQPAAPTKKNANFLGWYSDSNLSTAFQFSTAITAPTVIYAKWENYTAVEDMELAQTSVILIKDEEFAVNVVFTPENAKNTALVWSSQDESVATVDASGTVKAIAAGTTTITAALADNSLSKTLEFKVTVTNEENYIRIRRASDRVEVSELEVAVNDPQIIEAVVAKAPSNTATVQWTSSNDSIVKVTAIAGALTAQAKLEGIKPGTANVTVSLIDNDKAYTQSLEVTVMPLATQVFVKLGDENVTNKTVTYDLVTNKFIAVGSTKLEEPVEELSASVSPSGASQKVTWNSSNKSVVDFKDKEDGKVTANTKGTATITATAKDGSNISGKTTVNTKRIVQSFTLTPEEVNKDTPVVTDAYGRILLTSGCSVKLAAAYTPVDATDKRLKWEITQKDGNTKPVEINADKKIITAKEVTADTRVTVTATSFDEGGASYDIEFIIKPKTKSIEIYKADDMKHTVNGATIGVNPEKDSMTFTLRVKNYPENASQVVTWKSSNTKAAAIVDNKDGSGVVTVKGEGSCVITANAADGSGVKATTTVNVSSLASAIRIEGSNKVVKGGTIKLTAEVTPQSTADKSVEWTSETPEIASVNSKGEVTGKLKGVAVIRATAADGGGARASHTVIITDTVTSFDIMVPDGNTNEDDDVILTGKTVGIDLDNGQESYTAAARILPADASQTVDWKSDNEKVAVVDENGVITAKGLGKTVITASTTDGSGKKASITVNVATLVKSITVSGSHYVGRGKSIQLETEVTDIDAADKTVHWKSSDEQIVKVDKKGKVTAVAETGYAKITAEAADGSGVKAEHEVYIMGESDQISISSYDGDYEVKLDDNDAKYIEADMSDRQTLTIRLKADLTGGSSAMAYEKDVVWSTSNKNVAEISTQVIQGRKIAVVTVLKEGSVKITAKTADGFAKTDVCTLNIVNNNPVVVITGPTQVASGKSIKLLTGNTAIADWDSSNTALATVSAKGKVSAKKNVTGEVTITAYAKTGNHVGTYTVKVQPAVKSVKIVADGTDVTKQKLGVDITKGYNGAPLDLDAVVEGDETNSVTWKSNKKAVADVDENGRVTVKKAGTAVITATATDGSGKKATVTIVAAKQVTDILPADGKDEVQVAYKKSVQLKLSYKPLSATTKKVVWTSDAPSVVSVNKSSGTVKANRYVDSSQYPDGYITITASAADSGTALCRFKVYVTPPTAKVEVVESGKEYASVVGIDTDTNSAKINLQARLSDSSKNVIDAQEVTWKSSNTKIATVDSNGVVTGISNGKATITATACDGTKKTGKITVYVGKLIQSMSFSSDIAVEDSVARAQLNLRNNKTLNLSEKVIINPITATNKKLTYKSSNSKIVSVSSSGKLTAKKAGTADITISSTDGSGVEQTIRITVLN